MLPGYPAGQPPYYTAFVWDYTRYTLSRYKTLGPSSNKGHPRLQPAPRSPSLPKPFCPLSTDTAAVPNARNYTHHAHSAW